MMQDFINRYGTKGSQLILNRAAEILRPQTPSLANLLEEMGSVLAKELAIIDERR